MEGLQGLSHSLLTGEAWACSFDCLSMCVGCISKNLFDKGLPRLPEAPFSGYSISALLGAVRDFKYPFRIRGCGASHIRTLEAFIVSISNEITDDCENGIDISRFQPEGNNETCIETEA